MRYWKECPDKHHQRQCGQYDSDGRGLPCRPCPTCGECSEAKGYANHPLREVEGVLIPGTFDEATIAPLVEHAAARLRAWGVQSPKAEVMAADLVAITLRAAIGGHGD